VETNWNFNMSCN